MEDRTIDVLSQLRHEKTTVRDLLCRTSLAPSPVAKERHFTPFLVTGLCTLLYGSRYMDPTLLLYQITLNRVPKTKAQRVPSRLIDVGLEEEPKGIIIANDDHRAKISLVLWKRCDPRVPGGRGLTGRTTSVVLALATIVQSCNRRNPKRIQHCLSHGASQGFLVTSLRYFSNSSY